MRLTKKTKNGYFYKLFGDSPIYTKEQMISDLDDIVQKLGQLEDIEEELGIDLITLFKALKQDIYIKIVDDLMSEHFEKPIGTILKRQVLDTNQFFITTRDCDYLDERRFTFFLKDYGKTWALTKGELL